MAVNDINLATGSVFGPTILSLLHDITSAVQSLALYSVYSEPTF